MSEFFLPDAAARAEHLMLQVPQCTHASSSMARFVAMFAGFDFFSSITACARRHTGVAMIWNDLLNGRYASARRQAI